MYFSPKNTSPVITFASRKIMRKFKPHGSGNAYELQEKFFHSAGEPAWNLPPPQSNTISESDFKVTNAPKWERSKFRKVARGRFELPTLGL